MSLDSFLSRILLNNLLMFDFCGWKEICWGKHSEFGMCWEWSKVVMIASVLSWICGVAALSLSFAFSPACLFLLLGVVDLEWALTADLLCFLLTLVTNFRWQSSLSSVLCWLGLNFSGRCLGFRAFSISLSSVVSVASLGLLLGLKLNSSLLPNSTGSSIIADCGVLSSICILGFWPFFAYSLILLLLTFKWSGVLAPFWLLPLSPFFFIIDFILAKLSFPGLEYEKVRGCWSFRWYYCVILRLSNTDIFMGLILESSPCFCFNSDSLCSIYCCSFISESLKQGGVVYRLAFWLRDSTYMVLFSWKLSILALPAGFSLFWVAWLWYSDFDFWWLLV